ncbi:MAG: hypothetical protein SVM79_03400 [Chloroflexota bacterium]|nr:hypothetical protein [Chloroflexota bacterium]
MKRFDWQIWLGIGLLILSVVVYSIHYAIFRDAHHIFIYMVGDIAFVFIEVFMVTLIIHRVLNQREMRTRLEKMNMVIGAFFSEVGTKLLAYFSDFDPRLDSIRQELIVNDNWSEAEFHQVSDRLRQYDYGIEIKGIDLGHLTDFLVGKRDFLLRLLENPNLLEHESFTDLLRAVFHLTEELGARGNTCQLSDADCAHISIDLRRVYALLVNEWLDYMHHLKDNYPFYFSFAMRTNPFDQNASATID